MAVVQSDIKRIIAYSTISQLGYMVLALGVSAYDVSIFHLVTHAFFKALLFLGAGSVIIALHHEQDVRKMGNLRQYMPITFWCMLIGVLSMIGLPGLSGFFSKDLIITSVRESTLPTAGFAYYVLLASVFVTSLYSFRLLFLVFFGKERISEEMRANLFESQPIMYMPIIFLAIPSIVAGAWLTPSVIANNSVLAMFAHGFISIPFYTSMLGFLTAWLCYVKYDNIPDVLYRDAKLLVNILNNKYGFDALNEKLIVPTIERAGDLLWKIADMMCIDGFMVNSSAKGINSLALLLKNIQTGYLYQYIFVILAGFFVLCLWLFS